MANSICFAQHHNQLIFDIDNDNNSDTLTLEMSKQDTLLLTYSLSSQHYVKKQVAIADANLDYVSLHKTDYPELHFDFMRYKYSIGFAYQQKIKDLEITTYSSDAMGND